MARACMLQLLHGVCGPILRLPAGLGCCQRTEPAGPTPLTAALLPALPLQIANLTMILDKGDLPVCYTQLDGSQQVRGESMPAAGPAHGMQPAGAALRPLPPGPRPGETKPSRCCPARPRTTGRLGAGACGLAAAA
jgi:hypothetical protein